MMKSGFCLQLFVLFFTFLLSFLPHTKAQIKNTIPAMILEKIAGIQTWGDAFYRDGMIPTQRLWKKRRVEDDNIFYMALTAFNLQQLRPYLEAEDQVLADSIVKGIKANYPLYRNKNGKLSYNFWRTDPPGHFPNSKFLSSLRHFQLPDDLDGTSIIYLTLNSPDSIHKALKALMIKHTNLYDKKIKSVFKKYRQYRAYNTWFGDKMPLDFDICVMTNVMYLMCYTGLPFNQYDLETLQLIKDMINADDHIRYPHHISTYYKETSIILYHVARLLSICQDKDFQSIRPKVIQDIYRQITLADHEFEKIILATSLYRLGLTSEYFFEINEKADEIFEDFHFFVGNPFTTFPHFLKKWLSKSRKSSMKHVSDGYYWSLLLEYFLLSNRKTVQ